MYLVRGLPELSIMNTARYYFDCRIPCLDRGAGLSQTECALEFSSDTSRQEIARLCYLLVVQIELRLPCMEPGEQLAVSDRGR